MSPASGGAAINLVHRIEPEDRMRADFYALFARLFFAGPDAALLRMMGEAPLVDPEADFATASTPLAIAWARLSAAARVMDFEAACDEYDALFGGIGKSEISLFGAYYVGMGAPGAGGNFLVELREALSELRFSLQVGQNTPEDHVCAVFETMRLLIQGDEDLPPRDIDVQSRFFRKFVGAWAPDCCSAIVQSRLANFYKAVAECANAFLAVEIQSFAIA